MNQQQQRMAAVGTDKELSDLLDFSMVSEGARRGGGGGGFKGPGAVGRELGRGGNVSL